MNSEVAQQPLVSVVVPVYNGERFIGACLDSILFHQNYDNLEVIVVDDGSVDATAEIVRTYSDCVRVRYVFQENQGSAVARNKGIELATGQYVAFNDSDDLWAKNRLSSQVAYLEDTGEDLVCGRFQNVGEGFRLPCNDGTRDIPALEIRVDEKMSGWKFVPLLYDSLYHINTLLVRRRLLEGVSFDPKYRRGQDFDFWLQLANKVTIVQLDLLCAYYRQNTDSITHQPHKINYRAVIIENAIRKYGPIDKAGNKISQAELDNIYYRLWLEYGHRLFFAKWYKRALGAFFEARKYRRLSVTVFKYLPFCILLLWRDAEPPNQFIK